MELMEINENAYGFPLYKKPCNWCGQAKRHVTRLETITAGILSLMVIFVGARLYSKSILAGMTFLQYSVAFCKRPEAAIDVISTMFMNKSISIHYLIFS